jgi:uncharacterized protein (TIGR02271 family)
MPTVEDVRSWIGRELVGRDEEKLGTIEHVYLDRESGEPTFVSVKTGLFGMRSSLVPVQSAAEHADHIHVSFTKDQVKDAPNVEEDAALSEAEEQQLYAYYGIGYAGGYDGPDHESIGHDTSGPNTDDAMTRSEEELRIGKQSSESGRARLRKYVVTEEVSTTIPVSHEEATIEREPITDANRDAATSGADISEEEHEVVLHAEEPVVEKNVVAKERVRMGTETVTDDAEVSETVRKEQIEADGDIRER